MSCLYLFCHLNSLRQNNNCNIQIQNILSPWLMYETYLNQYFPEISPSGSDGISLFHYLIIFISDN